MKITVNLFSKTLKGSIQWNLAATGAIIMVWAWLQQRGTPRRVLCMTIFSSVDPDFVEIKYEGKERMFSVWTSWEFVIKSRIYESMSAKGLWSFVNYLVVKTSFPVLATLPVALVLKSMVFISSFHQHPRFLATEGLPWQQESYALLCPYRFFQQSWNSHLINPSDLTLVAIFCDLVEISHRPKRSLIQLLISCD